MKTNEALVCQREPKEHNHSVAIQRKEETNKEIQISRLEGKILVAEEFTNRNYKSEKNCHTVQKIGYIYRQVEDNLDGYKHQSKSRAPKELMSMLH